MMRPEQLLRLYPRAWRERYGDEFLAILAQRPSGLPLLDIVSGAIDAWLSADVRRATAATPGTARGGSIMVKSLLACERRSRVTTRDGLIGAGVTLGLTALLMAAGAAARRYGWPEAGGAVTNLASSAALMLSTPLWVMKGQPARVQLLIVGGSLVVLVAVGFIAAL